VGVRAGSDFGAPVGTFAGGGGAGGCASTKGSARTSVGRLAVDAERNAAANSAIVW
jgi:hypothetical protein